MYIMKSAALVLLVAVGSLSAHAQDDADLAKRGSELVTTYCYKCHGVASNGSPLLNVADSVSLFDEGYITRTEDGPVDLEESYLWQRLRDGEMPPKNAPQPTDEEKKVIAEWIGSGAPRQGRPPREFVSHRDMLQAIYDDVQKVPRDDRPYARYFTLTHLYNNVEEVTEFDMQLYRAAFSKAINSLSWEPEIVVPTAIDESQSIFRIDLRDIGWDKRKLWKSVLARYPYGMKFYNAEDEDLGKLDEDLEQIAGTRLAYIRADWLTVTATRPPMYDMILNLPATVAELEERLKVDVARNFDRNRIQRAGFSKSGVSTANRMVERHTSPIGRYYWKSFDFRKNNAKANLFQLPLGPAFHGNPFPELAFEEDGGEMIFGLPNGLQGYYLCDNKGKKISEGPIDVVRDLKETSGSPVVVNGISCMHCHQHGMITFEDTVRTGLGLFGDARQKARQLYVEREEMDRSVDRDREAFLRALEEATGPFLQVDEANGKSIKEFAEPVGAIARFYDRDVTLEQAAYEVGVENPDQLKFAIRSNPQLRSAGLGPLMNGDQIDRAAWQSRKAGNSPMQQVIRHLDIATPYNLSQF